MDVERPRDREDRPAGLDEFVDNFLLVDSKLLGPPERYPRPCPLFGSCVTGDGQQAMRLADCGGFGLVPCPRPRLPKRGTTCWTSTTTALGGRNSPASWAACSRTARWTGWPPPLRNSSRTRAIFCFRARPEDELSMLHYRGSGRPRP